MADPLVSIVVPNWNGAHLLTRCLESLLGQTYRKIEIIVVDGASTDGSQDLVSKFKDEEQEIPVGLLPLTKNLGFVGNTNAGLEKAHGTFLALVNNDVEVHNGWVESIIRAAEHAPSSVGFFASKVMQGEPSVSKEPMSANKQPRILSVGDYIQTNGYADSRGVREPDFGQFDAEEEVFAACGAAAVYRRELLTDVRTDKGYLHPALWAYLDDVEIALRAHLRGWKCDYVPQARVYHQWGQTAHPNRSAYFLARNTILVMFLGFPTSVLLRYWQPILTAQLRVARRAYRLRKKPGYWDRIRGIRDGLARVPGLWKERMRIQRNRTPDSADVVDRWLQWGDRQMLRRMEFDRTFLPLYLRGPLPDRGTARTENQAV